MIPWGSSVTIWCQGSLQAQRFRLHKEGDRTTLERQKPLEPGDKANFSFTHMTEYNAGRYHCFYLGPTGWSDRSDPLELVVTGEGTPGVPASGSALRKGDALRGLPLTARPWGT